MASRHAISGLTRPVGIRAVHLRLVPRPESMAESREILRLLESYGNVEMFKNLKYDALPTPNTMLAIFQSEEAAQRLLHRSPLRFSMTKARVQEEKVEPIKEYVSQTTPDSTQQMSSDRMALAETATATATARQPSVHSHPTSSTSPAEGQSRAPTREYQLQVNIATMHHRDHINANPYNGPFIVDTKSAVQEDLAKRVPMIGLSDVNLRKQEKPWRVLQWERERAKKQTKTLRQMLQEGNSKTDSHNDVT